MPRAQLSASDEEDDLEGLLEDAPDGLDDEDELVDWFATQLDIDDDDVEDLIKDAAETAGVLAALAMLKLFSAGWNALNDAQDDATEAQTEDVGQELTDRLNDISLDMADDLDERLDTGWGDDDGTEIAGLAEISAQSEYSESKSEADIDEGWEYSRYVAEADACDVCQACHDTVLPSDDPWWDDYEPDANHPNCRCIKVPLSESEAKAAGIDKEGPDVEASDWKDTWPPDVTGYPDVLEGIYHSKI
jgi:ribosomal protein L12E/L44/L45/RPP1/RPP2